MQNRNARIGLVLFSVYLVLYGGFVFLNAFAAEQMEATPLAGLNLAILYGFGLIIGALVLALLYGALCKAESPTTDTPAGASKSAAASGESSSAVEGQEVSR